MIVSFGDKRTRHFAEGNRIQAFSGFERKAELKLDQLDAAMSLLDLDYLAIVSKLLREIGKANTAFASTINGESASSGRRDRRDRSMFK